MKHIIKIILTATFVFVATVSTANAQITVKKLTLENDSSISCSTKSLKVTDAQASGVIFLSEKFAVRSALVINFVDSSKNDFGTFKSTEAEFVSEKNIKFTGDITLLRETKSTTIDVTFSSVSEGSTSTIATIKVNGSDFGTQSDTVECKIYTKGIIENEDFHTK